MVKLNKSQYKKLISSDEKNNVVLHFNKEDFNEKDTLDEVLTNQQINKINKRKTMGKGLRIKISPRQQKKYKDVINKKKIKNLNIGGKKQDSREAKAKKLILENEQLKMAVKELFEQMIKPIVKEKTGRTPKYSETLEKMLLTFISTQPEIISKSEDFKKLKDVDIFIKSIYDNIPLQGFAKGKGIFDDAWEGTKKALAKTAEIGINLMVNTSKNVLTSFKKKYVDNYANLIFLSGLLVDTALSTGGVGAIAVMANELGLLIAPAFLEAIKTELDVQLPSDIADPIKKVVSVIEGVNYAKKTINEIETALTGKVAETVVEKAPQLKTTQQGALEITRETKDILKNIPFGGKKGRPKKNTDLTNAINKILKYNI